MSHDWWNEYLAKHKNYVVIIPERDKSTVQYIRGVGWLWTTEHLAKSMAMQLPHSLDNFNIH